MSYLTITRVSGDPSRMVDDYRETADLMAEVGRDHGLLVHVAGPDGDGLVIVNLWPSRDRSEAAAADPRRRSVVAHHGLVADRFSREHIEVVNHVLFR